MRRLLGLFVADVVLVILLAGVGQATRQIPPRGPIPERPAIRINPTSVAPVVDGSLNDPCWTSAVSIRQFNLSYESRYCPYQTVCSLTYDNENLYTALHVSDPDPSVDPWLPYPTDRDANVAELLIAAPTKEMYYKVAIDSEGYLITTQPMGKTAEWHVRPSAVMNRTEDGWTAEFRAPFEGVDLPRPQPSASWRINIGWRTRKCTNYTAWAVTHAWFYEPQYFGDLYFGGPNALTAELKGVTPPQVGLNQLPLVITNHRETSTPCEVLVSLDQVGLEGSRVVFHEITEVASSGAVEVAAGYHLPDGISGVATVAVREKGLSEPLLRQSIPIDVAPNREVFRWTEAVLATLPPKTEGFLSNERSRISDALQALRSQVSSDNLSPQEWQALANPLERLHGQASKLLWWAGQGSVLDGAVFAVGSVSSLRKVLRDQAYQGAPAHVLSLSAARNEYEGVQILLIPLGQDLEGVEIETAPLAGPANAVIPKENIEVFWTDFVESRPPRYPIEYVGWIADPLIPMEKSPRRVPANAIHQPLWVTVHVPSGIPAGVYTGNLTVRASGGAWPLTLRLRVYGFDLPIRPVLRTSMWLNPSRIKDWYGWDEIPGNVLRKEMEFLLEHRINPAWFGPVGSDEDINWQIDHGLNLVMLGTATEWPLQKEPEEQISRYYNFFKERGLLDLTFIYGQDEPSQPDYPKVAETLRGVAERFPGVQRVCTAFPPVPELEGSVDTWVVGPNLFDQDAVAGRLQAGDELWLYLSASVRRPYVTQLYLDYSALEHRLLGWCCWKYGAIGFLIWGINEWESNNKPWSGRPDIDDAIREGKRWPKVPWNTWTYLNCNGDAQYIYPGPDGEFWSSVRMEIIRDSFEDYDYLALLRDACAGLVATHTMGGQMLAAETDALLTIGSSLMSDLTEATDDPDVLLQQRNLVAEQLERIHQVHFPSQSPP